MNKRVQKHGRVKTITAHWKYKDEILYTHESHTCKYIGDLITDSLMHMDLQGNIQIHTNRMQEYYGRTSMIIMNNFHMHVRMQAGNKRNCFKDLALTCDQLAITSESTLAHPHVVITLSDQEYFHTKEYVTKLFAWNQQCNYQKYLFMCDCIRDQSMTFHRKASRSVFGEHMSCKAYQNMYPAMRYLWYYWGRTWWMLRTHGNNLLLPDDVLGYIASIIKYIHMNAFPHPIIVNVKPQSIEFGGM